MKQAVTSAKHRWSCLCIDKIVLWETLDIQFGPKGLKVPWTKILGMLTSTEKCVKFIFVE